MRVHDYVWPSLTNNVHGSWIAAARSFLDKKLMEIYVTRQDILQPLERIDESSICDRERVGFFFFFFFFNLDPDSGDKARIATDVARPNGNPLRGTNDVISLQFGWLDVKKNGVPFNLVIGRSIDMDLSRRVSRRGATPIVTENDPYAIEPADSQGRSRDAPRESPPCPRKLEYFTRVKTYQRSDFFLFFFFFSYQ